MKRSKNWLSIILVALILITSTTTLYSEESDGSGDDITLAPYFFIEGEDASVEQFPLKETEVRANISGVIADIFVVQTYANEGATPINASYVFPAGTRAAVHGMKMEIGDKSVTAKIKEREEAKQEFEEAKSQGKSASLLEQQRPNVFSMNVANIMPGDVIRIELHYTELIVSTEGIYQFVFPTVVGPRYVSPSENLNTETDQWVASPYLKEGDTAHGKYNISVNLSTGVPITDLTCKSHKVNIERYDESAARVDLSDSEEFPGNRDYILEYKLTGQEVSCGLLLHSGETENSFMLMVQPPERIKVEDIPPREYIFVLDVSGSMYGYPLDTAKKLIKNIVSNLRETDCFNLILFSGVSLQMSPKSIPANSINIQRAIDLIDRQEGGGGTELAPALKDAVANPINGNVSRSVVIITDGYISAEKAIFDIINKNLGNTNFFSFGIGSGVNRYLIEGIAKAGLGESFVVTESSDAEHQADRFRTYIQSPVLTSIDVAYSGFDVYDIEPPILPDLFSQRPIIQFGKWRGEPTGTIRISGKTGSQNNVQDIQVSEAEPSETNMAIGLLWARSKVERLTDYGLTQIDLDATKKEVTAIGLKYSMMTPYTSFIAVIDEIRNNDKNSSDVKQPLMLPQGVSDFSIGRKPLPKTSATDNYSYTFVYMALISLSIIFLWRMRKKFANDDSF